MEAHGVLFISKSVLRTGRVINMTRSLKKGPYVDPKLLKKIEGRNPIARALFGWDRACQIAPEMVRFTFGVYNGKSISRSG